MQTIAARLQTVLLVLGLGGLLVSPAGAQPVTNKAPEIAHDPVTRAVRGQPLYLKAKVTDDAGDVRVVNLYYTLSKDAAPFRAAMRPAGLDLYVGMIDASVLAGAAGVSYYLEAEDGEGATRETPWYAVRFSEGAAAPGGAAAVAPSSPEGSAAQQDTWPIGWIAGGVAVAAGGAALLIAANDSGGGGSSGGGGVATNAGTYAGTATTCLTMEGQSPSCESHSASIVIDSAGAVYSDSLRAGQSLSGTLQGGNFTLQASVGDAGAGTSGEIFYSGTLVGDRIVGSITGSVQGPSGSGVYSGSFTATRQ